MKAMKSTYEVDTNAPSASTSSARICTALIVAGLAGAPAYSIPIAAKANAVESVHSVTGDEARAELKKITPPNAELLKLAMRFPAPQEWYDE